MQPHPLVDRLPKDFLRSSHCGAMGLVVSLQCQDTDLIPGPAQWVKGSRLLQLRYWSPLLLRSGPWSGNFVCLRVAKKKKKDFLGPQPPLDTPLDKALPHLRAKTQLHPSGAALPWGSLHKPLDKPHSPGGRHSKQENMILQPAELSLQTGQNLPWD